MQLTSCCRCFSLRTGTIFSGVCGIILSVITIIILFTTNWDWRVIVATFLSKNVVRIIYVINLCMTIIISTLLIIGALKKKTFLMLPWIILGVMLVVAFLISVIYTAVVFFIDGFYVHGGLCLAIGIICDVFFLYMWLVVFNYFRQLRIEKYNGLMGPYGRPVNNYRNPYRNSDKIYREIS